LNVLEPRSGEKGRKARPDVGVAASPLNGSSVQVNVAPQRGAVRMTEVPPKVDVLQDDDASRPQGLPHL
jgi:hypothetical protein